jgi:oxysterol-binding protein-related protein 3/6/7
MNFSQGFAKRYFVLYQSGILSYSFNPGEPIRDQISLAHAAISTAPYREDIHIDAGNATFHLKCLNAEDFAKWMAAMRSVRDLIVPKTVLTVVIESLSPQKSVLL